MIADHGMVALFTSKFSLPQTGWAATLLLPLVALVALAESGVKVRTYSTSRRAASRPATTI